MKTEVELAIKTMAPRITPTNSSVTADEALKFSQAALNLAHAMAIVSNDKTQTHN